MNRCAPAVSLTYEHVSWAILLKKNKLPVGSCYLSSVTIGFLFKVSLKRTKRFQDWHEDVELGVLILT